MKIRIQPPMTMLPYEIVPREFYAIEKGWTRRWNRKSREKVDNSEERIQPTY
jgi:hypothetical protein